MGCCWGEILTALDRDDLRVLGTPLPDVKPPQSFQKVLWILELFTIFWEQNFIADAASDLAYCSRLMKPSRFIFRLVLSCIALAVCTSSVAAQWVDSNRSGEQAWFFFESPTRAEVYDLAGEEWLASIELPVKSEALTAAYADADGIYLAYGTSLYRYDLSGGDEQFLYNSVSQIEMVVSDGPLLLSYSVGTYQEGYVFTSVSKSSNSLLDTYTSSSYARFGIAQLLRDQQRFMGIQGSTQYSLSYDAAGKFETLKSVGVSSPYPSQVWNFPGGDLQMTNHGVLNESFRNSTLRTMGVSPDEVVFRGADIPIVREGRKITALDNTDRELGTKVVDHAVDKLYLVGDQIFAFGANTEASQGVEVSTIPFSELGDPQPNLPKVPFGLAYTPESIFVGNNGVVHLFSRAYQCLFRWDPGTQTYLPTINLDGAPWHVSYAPVQNQVYVSYRNGRIERGILQDGVLNQTFFTDGSAQTDHVTIAARNYLLIAQRGTSSTIRSYNFEGNQVHQGPWVDTGSLFWDVSRQLLFSSRYGDSLEATPFRATSRYHASLGFGEFGIRKSSSSGQVGKVLGLTSTRNAVITSSGQMFDPLTLDLRSSSLGNEITDGLGFAGAVKTIRTISDVVQLQSWDGSSYAPGTVKQLPGEALRLIKAGGNLMAVVLSERGTPTFYLMNAGFEIIPPAALEQPGGVFAGVVNQTTVEISWVDGAGEEEYRVERRGAGESTWSVIGTTGTSVTTFEDLEVVPGITYEYRLTAVNGALESLASDSTLVEVRIPAAMADLVVRSVTENSVTLEWTPVLLATGYEFQYQVGLSGGWRVWGATAEGSSSSLIVTGLNTSQAYLFRARASNGIGFSPWVTVEGTTLPPLPTVPGNFSVSGTALSYQVPLRWYNQNGSEFVLERRLPGQAWVIVYTGSGYFFNDREVQTATHYEYRVKAQNSRGESAYTEVLEVSTPTPEIPQAPQFLRLRPLPGRQIQVYWALNDPLADTILIERRNDEGQVWEVIAGVDAKNFTDYVDADVTAGFYYTYQIKAINGVGESSPRVASFLAIDGVCLVEDDFESEESSPWVEIEGGERIVDGGQGFPDGGVLWFGGPWGRTLTTVPLDVRHGGVVTLTLRMGNTEVDGAEFWDDAEQGERLQVQYSEDGGRWQWLGSVNPDSARDWHTLNFSLPSNLRSRETRFRVIQDGFSGPGFDTWAIDDYCILAHRPQNLPPVFDDEIPEVLTANATADPITINMADYVSDENLIDTTYFSLVEVSNPAIFTHFSIDTLSGRLRLEFAPYQAGTSSFVVEASDQSGAVARTTMTVVLPELPLPVVLREGAVSFNAITGLFEHAVTIANNGVRPIAGFQLQVTGLNDGYTLWGIESGTVTHDAPLDPGKEITLHLEYHSPTAGSGPRPDFVLQLLYPEGNSDHPPVAALGSSLRNLRDEAKIFEFDATVGKRYQVQYSSELSEWTNAEGIVLAGANRVQWLDQGPPKTDCHPSECPGRYYRAIELED